MTITILFSISQTLENILSNWIDFLTPAENRAYTFLLKIIVWPFVYALTVARALVHLTGVEANTIYSVNYSGTTADLLNYMCTTTPMSAHCYGKVGFFFLFVEAVLVCYVLWLSAKKPHYIPVYLAMKVFLTVISFVTLSPIQHFLLWIVAFPYYIFDIWVGIHFFRTWGLGIDFLHGHFYHQRKKHLRFRWPTDNRIIVTTLAATGCTAVKVLALTNYFC